MDKTDKMETTTEKVQAPTEKDTGAIQTMSTEKLEGMTRRSSTTGSVKSAPDSTAQMVIGSTSLYDANGMLRLIPAPSPDPRDPLNLPDWRRFTAIGAVAFFGALALSAEAIIGALVPVFALEYAGINPKILNDIDISAFSQPGVPNLEPLAALAGLGGPPLWKVSLLSSLPLLTNGISSYFLVPLAIAIGRRPVILFCALLAWIGGMWAGTSHSLDSHIAARCVQGIGAGAVEALIPLMVQDIVFIHQRNRAMSSIWAAQGLIIVCIGIASPVIVGTIGWRFLYFLTSGLAIGAWLGLIVAMPETRWVRTQEELAGKSSHYIYPGENRPRLDEATYGKRTLKDNLSVFDGVVRWKEASISAVDTARTMFFPSILWATAVDSVFISLQLALAQTGSSVLIASGWKFKTLGLAVVPIVLAAPCVWLFSGYAADKIANYVAKKTGKREPEGHLLTLILPLILGILGATLFGYAGSNIGTVHWSVLLFGIFCVALAFLSANTIICVYAVESYPQWAGPVLVNISSFRCIIGFALSFKATTWVSQMGFLRAFGIYAGVLGILTLFLPPLYIYGKQLRKWTAGTVKQDSEQAAPVFAGAY